jgi:hypothetical protein
MFLDEPIALWPKPVFRVASTAKAHLLCMCLSLLMSGAVPLAAQDTAQPSAAAQPWEEYAATAPAAKPTTRLSGSDTVAYWYGTNYHTPFVVDSDTGKAANIQRHALEMTHLQFWSKGSNFADLMVSQSNMAEPASGGASGATEFYLIWRSNIGLNEISHSSTFRKGPLRDVAVEFGTNLETKNSAYSPAEKTLYIGPNLQMAMPRGYLNVGLHLRKEWNHEAVLGKTDDYDPNFNIEPTWLVPLAIGKVHLAYSGFAEYNTAKGKDSFGSETKPEFLIRSAVSVDLGALLFKKSQLMDLNGGLWYWHNEYGKPSSDPGAEQTTPIVGITFHLDGNRAHHPSK